MNRTSFSNNALLNSLLADKDLQAQQRALILNTIIVADTTKLPITDDDLLMILAELLDNAIKNADSGSILLAITKKEDYLQIIVKNNVQQDISTVDSKIIKENADNEQHGLGLKNVHNIVGKYQGTLQCYCFDHIFTSLIILPYRD